MDGERELYDLRHDPYELVNVYGRATRPTRVALGRELAAVAKITLNHQVRDGENFTVEGLRLEVGGQTVAVLASATCGGPMAQPAVQQAPAKPNKPKPTKQAPKPTPVKTSAPVTG